MDFLAGLEEERPLVGGTGQPREQLAAAAAARADGVRGPARRSELLGLDWDDVDLSRRSRSAPAVAAAVRTGSPAW
jgi:integrase